jgi:heme/copper-type cytochrome/quinol oxidase subunit 1
MTMHGTTMIFLAAMPLLFGLMNAVDDEEKSPGDHI